MFIRVFDEPKLNDPTFLSLVREGMSNGWPKEKMEKMGIKNENKHAYFKNLPKGSLLLYKAPNQFIVYSSSDNFAVSCSEAMKFIKNIHIQHSSVWVEKHIEGLMKGLESAVCNFLDLNGVSRESLDYQTLEHIYNMVDLAIDKNKLALFKNTKVDNIPRISLVKQLGLLDNVKIPDCVPPEAENRIRELLSEL